jgi:tRNA dimethylallyltransferase
MQVYRGMNIGTAKPSAAERRSIVHHAIDLVDPAESFTVARFVDVADGVIESTASRGVPLIATGGTPLYYKALFEGLFEGPSADAAVRERLSREPKEELHRRLAAIDPAAAARIHVQDTRRLVRALEVHELTGKAITSFQTEWASGEVRHQAIRIGLEWDRDELNRRINARVKQMMAAGWLDETRELLRTYGELSQTAGMATGYGELIRHLKGATSLDDAIEQIKITTRQLARRQIKWFRRFKNVRWLPGSGSINDNLKQVLALWRGD